MSVGAPTKVKLNIPQLTLSKLGQSGGHHNSGSQEVTGSNSTGDNIFC